MLEKIVLVTAGGAPSCFHAGMKKMHETLNGSFLRDGSDASKRFELWGANGGLNALNNRNLVPIYYEDIDENMAGSMVGADREKADIGKIKTLIKKENIYGIVMMGGDNHLGEANKCFEQGIPIVGYPKTIDKDICSLISLGWESCVTKGAKVTRLHHTTAMTTSRVFYVGLFGRNTDWVLAGASLYGGADIAIPSEQEYDWEFVWNKIKYCADENEKRFGKNFAVVCFSEGAKIKGIKNPPEENIKRDKHGEVKLRPEWIAMELERLTAQEGYSASSQVHTYSLREEPTKTDNRLSAMAGKENIKMILDEDFGQAVDFEPEGGFFKVVRKPLVEIARKTSVKGTGFFDYDNLKTTPDFFEVYKDLFRNSLGQPSTKPSLVYRNMLRRND